MTIEEEVEEQNAKIFLKQKFRSTKNLNGINNNFSPQETRKAIKEIKSKKAPGPDNITNDMLKQAQDIIVEPLTSSFNRMLNNEEKMYFLVKAPPSVPS